MNRRSFLKGILAAGVAPYVVTTAGVLMPVRKLWTPDDSAGMVLMAMPVEEPIYTPVGMSRNWFKWVKAVDRVVREAEGWKTVTVTVEKGDRKIEVPIPFTPAVLEAFPPHSGHERTPSER